MTEKRFISIEKWFDEDGIRRVHVVLDNGEFWHNFITQYDADKTCRKLNELAEENEQLKEENKFLNKQHNIYRDASRKDAREIKELMEDIDELNDKNQKLKNELEECRNNKLFSRRELERENKELKEEIETLHEQIAHFMEVGDVE